VTRRIRTDGFVDPCIPTLAAKPPSGPDWVHEIKHDGYRLIVRRDGKAVRLFTRRGGRGGADWPAERGCPLAALCLSRDHSVRFPDGPGFVAGMFQAFVRDFHPKLF
jgi:hypothetical protein